MAEFRAGAAVVDITPSHMPVLVNGGFFNQTADQVKTRLHARALVLDDGRERVGLVVVDTCMMPRGLLDDAKRLAAGRTKIAADRMVMAATHTHTAPSCAACLGTDADPHYVPLLGEKLAEALAAAEANLQPAQVGWGVGNAAQFTATRRWIRRPDRIAEDPFGNATVRANMHAAANWDDVTGPAGPEDPELSLISLQATDGRPIALLANFSMHYFGDQPLSADYYGLFCEGFESRMASRHGQGQRPFVAMMSHGCSGDIWRCDYTQPAESRVEPSIGEYTRGLLAIAADVYDSIPYRQDVDLAMAEERLPLRYRTPDQQRLEWARRIVESMGDRPPKDTQEVYAREQIMLHDWQATEVVLQALRIGDMAIATTSTETYALTGLKLKLQSPLTRTMVLELANGGDGYIPPPEQHQLGGYNTWPARSAGLEVLAEPKVTETCLKLLEKVAGLPRRRFKQSCGPAVAAVLAARPVAYWRLDELAGPSALDGTDQNRHAIYEPGVVFFLDGPAADRFSTDGQQNRAAHFAGGRLRCPPLELGSAYSVSLWFWNGMPVDGRECTGWMFSRGRDQVAGTHGDHLGIGGTAGDSGKLVFLHGDEKDGARWVAGRTEIRRWSWNHVVLVRDDQAVRVYLNGQPQPEIETTSPPGWLAELDQLFFGGRCDNQHNWEGRLDEVAVFGRALSTEDVAGLAVQWGD